MNNVTMKKHPLALAIAITMAMPYDGITAELEEVVVTAQKREQNMQEVPIAITAFSAEDLEIQGALTIVDIEKSTPNAQLRASRGTNSTLTAFIRGVGQQDPLWGFEPGVGLYIDDVYIARPQGAVLDVVNIERLEVLRGPQGTLYGKNTIGGAIKYVTKKMSGEMEGYIKGSVGSFNQRDLKAAGEFPLIDNTLYLGVSVANLTRDGFGTQFKDYDSATGTFGRTEENYNKDLLSGRVVVEYTPTDQWFFRLSGDKTEDDSNNRCGSRFDTNTVPGPNGEFFDALDDVYDSQCGMTEKQSVESDGYSFTASYDINDNSSVKYIYSDREGETDTFIDFDGTPLDSFEVPALYRDEQTTHELQFNYTNSKLALVGGIYFYEGTAAGAFDALFGQFGGGVLTGTQFSNAVSGEVDTESSAIYLNANINLTDALTLTLGGRYTEDEKATEANRVFVSTGNSFPGTTTQGSAVTFGDPADDTILAVRTDFDKEDTKNDWSEFTPTIKLDWKVNDDIMLFTGYAKGFKSGGLDMRTDAVVEPNAIEGYDPEIVDTYDLGIKSLLLDNRLRLNITAFHSDYQDMQVTVQAPAPAPVFFSSTVVNAGESTLQGIELESEFQITDSLLARLTYGYLDAEFDEVRELIAVGTDTNGEPILEEVNRAERVETTNQDTGEPIILEPWGMQNAPKNNWQFALTQDINLGNLGDLTWNAAVSFRDDVRMFEAVESIIDQEDYTLYDASLMWRDPDDSWNATLLVKNITDEEYRTGGYNFPATAGEDAILGFYGDPRTWTLSVGYKF